MAFATKMEDISSSSTFKFNWKIQNFSKIAHICAYSDVFSVGGTKWKVCMYPKGKEDVYDHISLFLFPVDVRKTVTKLEFSFAVTTQIGYLNNTTRKEQKESFVDNSKISNSGYGWKSFMCLTELHDPNKRYMVNDTCVISVEVTCWMNEDLTQNGMFAVQNPYMNAGEYPVML